MASRTPSRIGTMTFDRTTTSYGAGAPASCPRATDAHAATAAATTTQDDDPARMAPPMSMETPRRVTPNSVRNGQNGSARAG